MMDDLTERLKLMASGKAEVMLGDLEDAADEIEFLRRGIAEVTRYNCTPGVNVASFSKASNGEWVKWADIKYLPYGPNLVIRA